MNEEKTTVLIIEDDLDVADMLDSYFRVQGYNVITTNWGEDGLSAAQETTPDLIILDIRLPDTDGFEVAHRLRSNRRTENVPIIFLTEKRNRNDRLKGLELGADDYIIKPFDIQELRLRVRNTLRRAKQGPLNNPTTGLPEGSIVNERILNTIQANKPWAFLLVSLENLDHFREEYGFIAADDVLRAVSLMIQNTLRDLSVGGHFLGHLDKSRFLLISQAQYLSEITERVRQRFTQSLDYFYPLNVRDSNKNLPTRLHFKSSELISTHFTKPFSDAESIKTILERRLQ